MGLREKYEAHHKCIYALEAINAAVHLSARYISDRYLPDKAIDLIDEAGSRAHIEAFKKKKERQTCILSKSPEDYWQEIRTVQVMHEVVRMPFFCDAQISIFTLFYNFTEMLIYWKISGKCKQPKGKC